MHSFYLDFTAKNVQPQVGLSSKNKSRARQMKAEMTILKQAYRVWYFVERSGNK